MPQEPNYKITDQQKDFMKAIMANIKPLMPVVFVSTPKNSCKSWVEENTSKTGMTADFYIVDELVKTDRPVKTRLVVEISPFKRELSK